MRLFLCAWFMGVSVLAAGCAGLEGPPSPTSSGNVATPPSADPMASLYGNTIISNGVQGGEVHIWYKPDHTFTGKVISYGMALSGTWELKDGVLCRTYAPALPMIANPQCGDFTPHQIGAQWHANDRDNTLVAGVQ